MALFVYSRHLFSWALHLASPVQSIISVPPARPLEALFWLLLSCLDVGIGAAGRCLIYIFTSFFSCCFFFLLANAEVMCGMNFLDAACSVGTFLGKGRFIILGDGERAGVERIDRRGEE